MATRNPVNSSGFSMGEAAGTARASRQCPNPELGEHLGLTAVLGEQVLAGDPHIDHVIGDQLGNILRPHEEQVELDVAHPDRERAFGLLEDQPCVAQQRGGRLLEPSFVGNRQPEHPLTGGHCDPAPRRSSTSRYPPVP